MLALLLFQVHLMRRLVERCRREIVDLTVPAPEHTIRRSTLMAHSATNATMHVGGYLFGARWLRVAPWRLLIRPAGLSFYLFARCDSQARVRHALARLTMFWQHLLAAAR